MKKNLHSSFIHQDSNSKSLFYQQDVASASVKVTDEVKVKEEDSEEVDMKSTSDLAEREACFLLISKFTNEVGNNSTNVISCSNVNLCCTEVILEKYMYCQTSNISSTLVGNKIVDHSDLVGASPAGAAPTTSSFLTELMASADWAKTTARREENHLNFMIWCTLY